ncbi:MAG: hypothetical protein OXH86_10550 [Acidimicrobiaceae bacterium]|nr:hypothetical protein [Acidimicrobiaceae bacterium]
MEDRTGMVLAVLRGEVSIVSAARGEGVSAASIARWRDAFVGAGRAAVAAGGRRSPSGGERQLAAEIEQFNTALGEAHMELRLWRKGGSLHGAWTGSAGSGARP